MQIIRSLSTKSRIQKQVTFYLVICSSILVLSSLKMPRQTTNQILVGLYKNINNLLLIFELDFDFTVKDLYVRLFSYMFCLPTEQMKVHKRCKQQLFMRLFPHPPFLFFISSKHNAQVSNKYFSFLNKCYLIL